MGYWPSTYWPAVNFFYWPGLFHYWPNYGAPAAPTIVILPFNAFILQQKLVSSDGALQPFNPHLVKNRIVP